MPRNIILFLTLFFCSLSSAQSGEVMFRRNGAGLWLQEGAKSELVVVMEMRRERNDQLTLTVRPINGIPRRFTGTMSEPAPSGYYVAIASSAKERASGTIYVENNATGAVQFVIGYAEVGGRRIAFHFTKHRPLRTNALVIGSGILISANMESKIVAASILTTMARSAEVSLVLENGTVRRFNAAAPKETSGATKSELDLDAGNGTTGLITVERDRAKYQVKKIEGSAESETGKLTFNFEASSQQP